MTKEEAISSAIKTIGKGENNDYVLAPVAHAEQFKESAPELAAILSTQAINGTASDYEREDVVALQAQRSFKLVFNRANILILVTGILITVILTIGNFKASIPDNIERILIIGFSLLSVVTGALASRDLFLINQGQLLERWMTRRAGAETFRLDYFNWIAKAALPPADANDTKILFELLKLEYFRRFQLDIQLAFYGERGAAHEREATKLLNFSSFAVAIAAIAAGFAGILGAAVDTRFAVLAAVGTIFTSVTSFTALKEGVSQNRRNAERYKRTFDILNGLNKQLDDVREVVFAEGAKPLTEFVNAVNEQISLEHRQWVGDKSEYQKSIADLNKTIADYKAKI